MEPARVLVVDDSVTARQVIAARLHEQGYGVDTAPDGPTALERIAGGGFDAVLLDSEMPGMSGLAVLERIRGIDGAAHLPVLMVTANPDSAHVVEALGKGASDYLVKPVTFPVLFARLDTLVARRRAERENLCLRRNLEQQVARRTEALQEALDNLRINEERFQTLAMGAPVGIFRADDEGRFVYVNRRWCAIAGLSLEQALGDGWIAAVHPDDREAAVREWRAAVDAQRPLRGEFRLGGSGGGGAIWVFGQADPERDREGRIVGYVGTVTDIDDRHRAEAEVRASRQLLQTVIDTLPFWLSVRDREGRYLLVNASLAKSLAASPGGVVGHTILEAMAHFGRLGRRNRAEVERVVEQDLQVVRTGQSLENAQYTLRGLDGRISTLRQSVFPLADPGGAITGVVAWSEDVTEHVKAQAIRERSERVMAQAERIANLGAMEWNLASGEQYWSDGVFRVLGHEPQTFQAGAEAFAGFLHAEDKKRVLVEMAAAAAGKRGVDLQCRVVRRDGAVRTVHARGEIVADPSGAGESMVGTVHDVTDRQRAESALRESEQRFRDYAESSADWFWEMDADLRFTYMSPAVKRLLGVEPEWHYGKTRRDLLGEGYDPAAWDAHLRTLDERKPFRNFTYLRVGGGVEPRWLSASGVPVFSGEGTFQGYRGSGSDITERVRAEAEVRAGRQLLQTVVDTVPFLVSVRDREGRFQLSNAALAKFYGVPARDLIGHSIPEVVSRTPGLIETNSAAVARVVDADRQVLRTGRPLENEQYSVEDGQAMKSTWRRSIFPLTGPQGEIAGVVAWSENITERLHTEHALRAAQKLEALGHLTGNVTHDFNNMLQIVRGFAQVAQHRIAALEGAEDLRAQVESDLKYIVQTVEQGSNLTRQLLAFSRGSDLRPAPVDLNAHVRNRVDMLRMAVSKAIEVDFQPGNLPGPILADPGMLDQVLLNLSINARDAMDKGGRLRLATEWLTAGEEDRARHALDRPGDYAVLTIEDTGQGMSPEVQARIFEPFFTTKGEGRGTGLGLSVVHGIVRQHKGQIAVESEVGRGTTFRIYWPAAA